MNTVERETLVVAAVLVGAVAVSYLLPTGTLPSLLLVTFAVLLGVFVLLPGTWPALYRATGVGRGGWLLAMGVAAAGVSLSYAVGDPRVSCGGSAIPRCLTGYGWASAAFLGSTVGVAMAVGHLGRYRRLRNASLVPTGEVDAGLSAVEGRIVPAGSPVPGPVSDEPTVWYRRIIERATLFEGYREVDRESTDEPFYVEDASGRLLVLPDRLDDYDVGELSRSHATEDEGRRRREWHFRPGDAVTVIGHATEVSRAEYPEPVAVGLEGSVIVGRRPLEELRSWAARRAIGGGLVAVVIGVPSLLAMVLAA